MKYKPPQIEIEEYEVRDIIAYSPPGPTEPGGPPDDPYIDDKF